MLVWFHSVTPYTSFRLQALVQRAWMWFRPQDSSTYTYSFLHDMSISCSTWKLVAKLPHDTFFRLKNIRIGRASDFRPRSTIRRAWKGIYIQEQNNLIVGWCCRIKSTLFRWLCFIKANEHTNDDTQNKNSANLQSELYQSLGTRPTAEILRDEDKIDKYGFRSQKFS